MNVFSRIGEYFKDNKKDNVTLIGPCLGIRIFTWGLIFLFSLSIFFLVFVMVKEAFFSIGFYLFCLLVLLLDTWLYAQMAGTHLVLGEKRLTVVKNVIFRTDVDVCNINRYRCSASGTKKGEYPENLQILCENSRTVNFNIGLCSKKDLELLWTWFEQKNITGNRRNHK